MQLLFRRASIESHDDDETKVASGPPKTVADAAVLDENNAGIFPFRMGSKQESPTDQRIPSTTMNTTAETTATNKMTTTTTTTKTKILTLDTTAELPKPPSQTTAIATKTKTTSTTTITGNPTLDDSLQKARAAGASAMSLRRAAQLVQRVGLREQAAKLDHAAQLAQIAGRVAHVADHNPYVKQALQQPFVQRLVESTGRQIIQWHLLQQPQQQQQQQQGQVQKGHKQQQPVLPVKK
ncbi:hypothetical protein ACA910_015277 [Epithemia clementina (nom. ined.)]